MELKNFFAQDTKGNVVPFATVTVYNQGTTVRPTIYGANGSAITNPFNVGNTGLAQFRAANGEYDVKVITDDGEYTLTMQCNDVNDSVDAAAAAADRAETEADRAEAALESSGAVFDSVADLDAATNLQVGQKVRTLGYYSPGDGGGNDYEIVAAGAGTDDGGSFIDLSGSGTQARGLFVDGSVSVRQFGATHNASSDEHQLVQNALDYLDGVGGGTLTGKNTTVRCDFPVFGGNRTKIDGSGGFTLDYSNSDGPYNSDTALLYFYGGQENNVSLSQDAVYGENVIYVNDASQFEEGDLVEVSMNAEGSYPDTSIDVKSGQFNIIQEIDLPNNKIILDTIIYEKLGYTISNSARIRVINPIEDITIEGLTVIGPGRRPTNVTGDGGIVVAYGRNVTIRNCKTVGVDGKAIEVISCYHAIIDNNECVTDKIGTTNSSVSYGISYSSSYFVVITNNKLVNFRHSIISSHISSWIATHWPIVSRFIVIDNNSVTGNFGDLSMPRYPSSSAGIATHTDVEFLKITNNSISACMFGINPRTWNIEVSGNTIEGCGSGGIHLSGKYRDLIIKNNTILNCGAVINFQSSSADDVHDNLHIVGNKAIDCRGILAVPATNTQLSTGLVISDNHIINNLYSGLYYALTILGRHSGVVSNNTFNGVPSTGGILIEDGDCLVICDNKMFNVAGRPISATNTNELTVSGNITDYLGLSANFDDTVTGLVLVNNHMNYSLGGAPSPMVSGNFTR